MKISFVLTPKGWAYIPQQISQKLSDNILFLSVTYFSGANAFAGIYEKLIPAEGFSCKPNGVQPHQAWNRLLEAMKNSSLEANNLRSAVLTRNNLSSASHLTEAQAIDLGIRDASWGPIGREKKQQREQNIFAAANTIASAWRRKKDIPPGNGRVSSMVLFSIFKTKALPKNLSREMKEELLKHSAILNRHSPEGASSPFL